MSKLRPWEGRMQKIRREDAFRPGSSRDLAIEVVLAEMILDHAHHTVLMTETCVEKGGEIVYI